MVRVRINPNVDEDFDWNEVPFGVTSNDFNPRFGHSVVRATARAYEIDYGDGESGVYEGRNLRYAEVTVGSKTLDVPNRGVITGYSEGEGFSVQARVNAREILDTARTRSNDDNIALWNDLLSGNDDFRLGGGDDVADMRGGNDRVRSGDGEDEIDGGRGNDRLWGGDDEDVLDGGAGNDRLWGGADADVLEGGKGNDQLTGGGGRDEFLFEGRRLGRDTIRDFSEGDDIVIDARRTDEFSDLRFTDRGNDVLVRWEGTTLRIKGLNESDLDAGMFDFI
ncbi:MAG: hypothetical protein AAGI51_04255 [Pseudomonadota bacterium]